MNEENGHSQGWRQTGASCAARDTKASLPVVKIEYHYGFYAATHAEYHAFREALAAMPKDSALSISLPVAFTDALL